MSRTSVQLLACLMTLSACSTGSSLQPRKPDFVTAECPPQVVRVDRSFAAAPPPCLETMAEAKVSGGSWLGIAIDIAEANRLRDICLGEVAEWLKAEREARTNGTPGA